MRWRHTWVGQQQLEVAAESAFLPTGQWHSSPTPVMGCVVSAGCDTSTVAAGLLTS